MSEELTTTTTTDADKSEICTLEQEVDANLSGKPEDALRIKTAMEEGRFTGDMFTTHVYRNDTRLDCGCWYGTKENYDGERANNQQRKIWLRIPGYAEPSKEHQFTFIEDFIFENVEPGDTPQHNKYLRKLYLLTLPYCPEGHRESKYDFSQIHQH